MNESHYPISRRAALRTGSIAVAGAALAGTQFIQPAHAATTQRGGPPAHVRLTPSQQAGQRVIFSYPGLTPPERLLKKIRAGEVGGVIFFGENISSLTQIAEVVRELKKAHAKSDVRAPLILTTDQEGGVVRRLPGAPEKSEKEVGESADPLAEAAKAGTGAGENLAGVGMNLNLAPVLDVFRTPGNFDDQWGRSYSSDPAVAGKLGAAFVRAQQGVGVAATAKHFPGLGAATREQNTDLKVVTLDQPLSEIRDVDESAFAPSIAAGVDLVMTSWAVYPALDAKYPAGLSQRIVQGELRDRLHFRGVTMTDAIEAGALKPFGSYAQRGVLAAQAGMDLLLCSARDVSQGENTVAAVTKAYESHRLNPGHFKNALRRVIRLRGSLG
ncbi:glycoside hydrolase family 3 N-terminal domain-containing protein [Spelaeicoccus albus]|uniref:Beta-N-acetylhexosaminidase n=1 Tax=Spelaeicoccus albus TaxID=1280376 RepID=A0A7Z0D277_9MICO|nr:glycoside hydrolase family 3 N-terminal domain-containing protein [Spelaeicoccus albus]NYI67512.1 beta-N-acetylhexosaminidase [Spelaeicoccus albus]